MDRQLNPVALWLFSLDQDDAPREEELRHEDDRQRCGRIALPRRKRQFIFRRLALRHVLDQYLSHYHLEAERDCKPRVVAGAGQDSLHFSVSASRTVCAICVGATELGIDIEAMPPQADLVDIVREIAPEMQSQDPPAEESAALHAFRQHLAALVWCRLEACSKLLGRPLHEFLVANRGRLAARLRDPGLHLMAVASLDYVCVIAQGQPFRISRVFRVRYSNITHA